MKIIGLHGKARSGKDTAGGILLELDGYTPIAFADKLRQSLLKLDPFIESFGVRLSSALKTFTWEELKVGDAATEIRQLMQRHGDAVRYVDPNAFINGLFSELDPNGKYVVKDVRFENEALAILGLGGLIVRIDNERPVVSGNAELHHSENPLPDNLIQGRVNNSGTLDDLRRQLHDVVDYACVWFERSPVAMQQPSHYASVRLFCEKAFGELPKFPTIPSEFDRKTHSKLIIEEALETISDGLAMDVYINSGTCDKVTAADFDFQCSTRPVDLAEIADGAADLNVVCNGMGIRCGIDMEPVQRLVDHANLQKFGPGGYRREDGKWVKPPNFIPPDIVSELVRQSKEAAKKEK